MIYPQFKFEFHSILNPEIEEQETYNRDIHIGLCAKIRNEVNRIDLMRG